MGGIPKFKADPRASREKVVGRPFLSVILSLVVVPWAAVELFAEFFGFFRLEIGDTEILLGGPKVSLHLEECVCWSGTASGMATPFPRPRPPP